MIRAKYSLLFVVVSIVAALTQQSSAPPPTAVSRTDGTWWQSASQDERNGFLAGTDDCLSYDVHKPLLFFVDDWDKYEKDISHFYETNPGQLGLPVFDVIRSKLNLKRRTTLFKPAEYGHDWWRQASSAARLGFIDGLTSCRRESKHGFLWDIPTDDCVRQLDYIYDASDVKRFNGSEYQGEVSNAYRHWCFEGMLGNKVAITVKSSSVKDKSVMVEARDGRNYLVLECTLTVAPCTALEAGKYWMVRLGSSTGLYMDCPNVDVYSESSNGKNDRRLGEYCLLQDRE